MSPCCMLYALTGITKAVNWGVLSRTTQFNQGGLLQRSFILTCNPSFIGTIKGMGCSSLWASYMVREDAWASLSRLSWESAASPRGAWVWFLQSLPPVKADSSIAFSKGAYVNDGAAAMWAESDKLLDCQSWADVCWVLCITDCLLWEKHVFLHPRELLCSSSQDSAHLMDSPLGMAEDIAKGIEGFNPKLCLA